MIRPRISEHSISRLLPEFEKAKEETGSKEQDLSIEQEIDLKVCKHNISVIHPCGNANLRRISYKMLLMARFFSLG
jgi:hypothetical protein